MTQLYGTWKVTLPGETCTREPDEMLGSEWKLCKDEFGGDFEDWVNGFVARDPDACQVLIWWLRSKKGINLDRVAVDFKIRQLVTEQIPDPEGEAVVPASTTATSETSSNGAGELVTSTP
jgi:hypothetical protein